MNELKPEPQMLRPASSRTSMPFGSKVVHFVYLVYLGIQASGPVRSGVDGDGDALDAGAFNQIEDEHH